MCDTYNIIDLLSIVPWLKSLEINYQNGGNCHQVLNLQNLVQLEKIVYLFTTSSRNFVLFEEILINENSNLKHLEIDLNGTYDYHVSEIFKDATSNFFAKTPNLEFLRVKFNLYIDTTLGIFDGLIGAKDVIPNLKHLDIDLTNFIDFNFNIFGDNFGSNLEAFKFSFKRPSLPAPYFDLSKVGSLVQQNPNLKEFSLLIEDQTGVQLDSQDLMPAINSLQNLEVLYLELNSNFQDSQPVVINKTGKLQDVTLKIEYSNSTQEYETYSSLFLGTALNYMEFPPFKLKFPTIDQPFSYTKVTQIMNSLNNYAVESCTPGSNCMGCNEDTNCIECMNRTHGVQDDGTCTAYQTRCENDLFIFPECVECKGNKDPSPDSDCYNCLPQYIQDQSVIPYLCEVCKNNYEKIGEKCICPDLNLSQPDPFEFAYCNTCDTAFATFLPWSYDLYTIQFRFHEEMPELAEDSPLKYIAHEYTQDLCEYLFQSDIEIDGDLAQNIFGSKPYCRYQKHQKLMEIRLGENNKFYKDTPIRLNPGTIFFNNVDCTQEESPVFISNLLIPGPVLNPEGQILPSFSVSFPEEPILLCQETVMNVSDFSGCGGKIPKISWNLVSSNSTVVETDLISMLEQASVDSVDSITFPPNFFKQETEYVLQVEVLNFMGNSSSQEFNIVVKKSEGILSEFKIQGENSIMKKSNSNVLEAIHLGYRCQDGAIVNVKPDSFQITIQDVTDPLNLQDLASYTSSEFKSFYFIEPFSMEEGSYEYKLVVEKDGDMDESVLQFVIRSSPLLAQIQDGDRTHCYLYELNLVGIVLNPSVPEENQKDGVTPSWSCKDLTNGTPSCIDYNDDPLVFTENSFSQTFGERVLKPYVNYQFSLTVEKDGDTSTAHALIFVAESTMPQLSVQIPDKFLLNKVNIDEDIVATLQYDGDVESTRFSVLVLYNFENVATKQFYYNEFSFQLQDLFNGFNLDNDQVVLKFSTFDPRFYLPTYVSVPININIGAQGGVISINQNIGQSLNTQFTISIDGLEAKSAPLQYKLSYYQNINSYDEATSLGNFFVNQNQNMIFDYQSSPEFSTILPTCEVNPANGKNECTLAISVKDRLGAVRNTTQTIEVSRESGRETMELITELEAKIDLTLPTPLEQITYWNLLALDMVQFDQKIEYCDAGVCHNDGECLQTDSTFSCECKPDFFLNNCAISGESNYQSYLQAKKKLYDKITVQLRDLSGIPITESIVNQMRKSQNILNNNGDLIKLQDESELNELYTTISSDVDSELLIIENGFLVDLQSRSNVNLQRKVQKSVDSLNKFLISVDNCQQGLFKQDDMEKGKDFIGIIDKISSTFQKISHVNGDQKWYKGKSFSTQVGKSTQNIINQQFFGDKSKLQSLLTKENENESIENPGIYFNEPTDLTEKIYVTQQRVFPTNPYQKDENFPFKNYTNKVQDPQINLIVPETPAPPSTRFLQESDGNSNTLRQPIKIHFEQDEIEGKEIENVCIQKQASSWDQTACRAEEQEKEDGKIKFVCVCDKLSPTSIGAVSIDVLSNVIVDSQLEEVFGSQGIQKLQEFEYHKSTVVYIYATKLVIYIICMFEGRRLDKNNYEDFGKQEEEQEKQEEYENEIEKNGNVKDLETQIEEKGIERNRKVDGESFSIKDLEKEENDNEKNIKSEGQSNSFLDLEVSKDIGQNGMKGSNSIDQNLSVKNQTRLSKKFNLNNDTNNNSNNSSNGNDNDEVQQETENIPLEKKQSKVNKRTRGSRVRKTLLQKNIKQDNSEQQGVDKMKKGIDFSNPGLNQDVILEEQEDEKDKEEEAKTLSEFKNIDGNLHIDLKSQSSQRQEVGLQIDDEATGRHMLSKRSSENEGGKNDKEKQKKPKKDVFYPEISEKQQKKLELKGIWEALFIPHVFFGIFLAYDRKLSRPKRLTVYYVNMLLLLALSSIFTQNAVDQFYSIVLSSFIAFLLNVPMAIINFLFKHKKRVLNLMGFGISILIKLVATYMIITAAAILGVEKSNVWCEQYFTVLLIDQLFTQTVKNSLMVYCIKKNMTLKKKNMFSKVFKSEYVAKYLANI